MFKRIFAPGTDSWCTSLALLVLRLWIGATMCLNHGLAKLKDFGHLSAEFPDPLGVGHGASLSLVLFAEVVCSSLLVLGLVTRFAALVLIINMAVAFFAAHKAVLSGPRNGELAFIYMAAYVALLIAGPGKFSADKALFGNKNSPGSPPTV